jgi:hypothetical protein
MKPERSEAEGARDWKTFSPGGGDNDTNWGGLPIQKHEVLGSPQISVQPTRWLAPLLVLMSSVTAISVGYMLHARVHAAQLSAENRLMSAALAQMRHEVDALTLKVNNPNPGPAAAVQSGLEPERGTELAAQPEHLPGRIIADGQAEALRLKRVHAQMQGGQKQLTGDRDSLENARAHQASDVNASYEVLTGSIARNHEELVGLQQRGERNYFEFDLAKSKDFERIGPLSLSLRKVNSGRQRYNIELLVGDNRISKKDLTIDEPLLLYPEDSRRPLELVVNRIAKDKIHGYVSAPRYSDSELESKGAPAEGPAQSVSSGSQLASKTGPEQSWGVKFRKLVSRLR